MRTSILIATLAVVTATASSSAVAQVVAYHHRSTVYGDWTAGAAELVGAQGRAAVDYARAYEISVRADHNLEDLRQKRLQAHLYEREYRIQMQREKTAERRQRQASEEVSQAQTARELILGVQHGTLAWPVALQRPEYAHSMRMIESILANWSPASDTSFRAYRSALATEAGVLRVKISSSDRGISFLEKVAAVRTLKTLQWMASADVAPADGGVAHLALR
jgi:hypothetical protein